MKRAILISIFTAGIFWGSSVAHVSALSIKLPYAKGQRFIVVQGYNTAPTHIGHDAFALDLSQNGCAAYSKQVVAASAGTAMIVQEQGYNGGYGTELVINHGNYLISRYAHMIPGSIDLGVGASIQQGQVIGQVGDTGLVAGLACPDHPGTHLHFAMDIRANDGTLTAYKPEPISGYQNVTAGSWYLSDNEEEMPTIMQNNSIYTASSSDPASEISTPVANPFISVAPIQASTSSAIPASSSIAVSSPLAISTISNVPNGGVSIVPNSSPSISAPFPALITVAQPESPSSSTSSSTSTIVSTDVSSSSILFKQLDNSVNSHFSWYDDNWFNLGTGLSGTLSSLILEGKISSSDFFTTRIALQEFKDTNYTAMIQSFDISDDAPFTATMATATFDGLSILLKPYFYYRLATVQGYQNRSVILAGTSSTGTYMWNNFVYGVGRVEYTEPFTPYIVMTGIAATSTSIAPALTVPKNIIASFDPFAMEVSLVWSASTDPDWASDKLHYEINYSTSSVLSDSGWGSTTQIPVVVGNSYLIGVRAGDDFGDMSAIATTTWNFPAGFEKYYISPSLSYATQEFTVPTTTTLNSIQIFITNLQTSARYIDSVSCSLALDDMYGTTISSTIPSDDGYSGGGCNGPLTFSFASSSPMLVPNDLYRWTFQAQTGNPSTQAWAQFYGTAENIAGGFFSDPSFPNAKFVINGASGTIFAN